MTSCLVLVEDFFISDTVNDTDGLLEDSLSRSFITCFHSLQHLFDRGAESGALAGIVLAGFLSLTCTLASLGTVSHVLKLLTGLPKKRANSETGDDSATSGFWQAKINIFL
jgi:hypothetical protein